MKIKKKYFNYKENLYLNCLGTNFLIQDVQFIGKSFKRFRTLFEYKLINVLNLFKRFIYSRNEKYIIII